MCCNVCGVAYRIKRSRANSISPRGRSKFIWRRCSRISVRVIALSLRRDVDCPLSPVLAARHSRAGLTELMYEPVVQDIGIERLSDYRERSGDRGEIAVACRDDCRDGTADRGGDGEGVFDAAHLPVDFNIGDNGGNLFEAMTQRFTASRDERAEMQANPQSSMSIVSASDER